jgi:hypothetical protein
MAQRRKESRKEEFRTLRFLCAFAGEIYLDTCDVHPRLTLALHCHILRWLILSPPDSFPNIAFIRSFHEIGRRLDELCRFRRT